MSTADKALATGRDPAAQRGALAKTGGGFKSFDFTKIAHNGTTLPAGAALGIDPFDWACTYDNNTGLLWEVKTATLLRAQSRTCTWYDSVHNYGGSGGTSNGGTCFSVERCDTEKSVADVNATNQCGHNDWRLPTVDELANLANIGIARPGPTIDTTYFPKTQASGFWSGFPLSGDATAAWYVDFNYRIACSDYRYLVYHVRLVRAGL